MQKLIRYCLILVVGCLVLGPATAQRKTKITILHSDIFKPDTKKGINRLIGNVQLEHNGLLMYCDSLYQYADSNYIEAFGSVHAVQNDSLHMYGDYMTYDGNTQQAKVRDHVILEDNEVTLTTNFLDYDVANRIGHYFNKGQIKDNSTTLTSDLGYYFADMDLATFKDSVSVLTTEYRLYSDTMRYKTVEKIISILGPTNIYGDSSKLYSEDGWYNSLTSHAELYKNNRIDRQTMYGLADTIIIDSISGTAVLHQNIFMKDTANNVIIEGNKAELFRDRDYAYVTERALLTLVGSPDSLFVHADTLTYSKDSLGNNVLMALHNSKFFNPQLQGAADSLIYFTTDSTVYMRNNPIVWASGNQMTANLITMKMKDNKADQFNLIGNAMIVNEPQKGLYNQIKGRDIIGYIRDNELRTVFVDGSGEVLYYPDENGNIIGMSRVVCSTIRIHLDDSKVKTIVFMGKPEGTTTPLFKVNSEESFLRDFRWDIDLRPTTMEEIFTPSPKKTVPKKE